MPGDPADCHPERSAASKFAGAYAAATAAATPNSTLKGPGEKLRPRLYSNSVVRYVREKRTANVILGSI